MSVSVPPMVMNKSKSKSRVQFAPPSVSTSVNPDAKLRFPMTTLPHHHDLAHLAHHDLLPPMKPLAKSQSAEPNKSMSTRVSTSRHKGYSYGKNTKGRTQTARWKGAMMSQSELARRNKSLLLDPAQVGDLTHRHARYSSMAVSPQLKAAMARNATKAFAPSFADLDLNAAIHSLDNSDLDEEEDFYTERQLHQHTQSVQSSLTIDSHRYSLQSKASQKVPAFHLNNNHNSQPNPLVPSSSAEPVTSRRVHPSHSAA